jgi:hypothetical protein
LGAEKLEAKKMLENAAESPASNALSLCFSGTLCWAVFIEDLFESE